MTKKEMIKKYYDMMPGDIDTVVAMRDALLDTVKRMREAPDSSTEYRIEDVYHYRWRTPYPRIHDWLSAESAIISDDVGRMRDALDKLEKDYAYQDRFDAGEARRKAGTPLTDDEMRWLIDVLEQIKY